VGKGRGGRPRSVSKKNPSRNRRKGHERQFPFDNRGEKAISSIYSGEGRRRIFRPLPGDWGGERGIRGFSDLGETAAIGSKGNRSHPANKRRLGRRCPQVHCSALLYRTRLLTRGPRGKRKLVLKGRIELSLLNYSLCCTREGGGEE